MGNVAVILQSFCRPVRRNADTFGYDYRSQLTAATLRSAATNAYAYAYDGAGNRQTSGGWGEASRAPCQSERRRIRWRRFAGRRRQRERS